MANYQTRPAGITIGAIKAARTNGGQAAGSFGQPDSTLLGTTGVDTGVAQPTDPGVAAAVRHSQGQWP
jgi:hypothetical protein